MVGLRRWVGGGLAAVVLLAAVVALGGWLVLPRIDLASVVAGRLSAKLGRDVRLDSLHVVPGRTVVVRAAGLRVANLPGGRADMLTIPRVEVVLAAWPLLHGALEVRDATVEGMDLLLERVGTQGPNWRFAGKKEGGTPRPPERDGSMPLLRKLVVSGKVLFRTSADSELPIGLDRMTVTADGLDGPLRIEGPGSYKGVPITVAIEGGSIAQYRQAATPFPAKVDMRAEGTRLRFDGTFVDPLNANGADGSLTAEGSSLRSLYRIMGAEGAVEAGFALRGRLEHAEPAWQISELSGHLGEARLREGTVRLEEGQVTDEASRAATPDRLGLLLDFARVDVDSFTGGGKDGRKDQGGDRSAPLSVEAHPTTVTAATLRAEELIYKGTTFHKVAIEGSQAPGEITLKAFSLAYGSGKVSAHGTVAAAENGGKVELELDVAGLDIASLHGLLGTQRLPITGRLDGRAAILASGDTVEAATPGLRASVVATMSGGTVSRDVVRLGSTDLRALFGSAGGTVPLRCAALVMDVRGGVGTIAPLLLRTTEGTVGASGTVNFARQVIDAMVGSDPDTTAGLALDVPVHVSGPIADPSIAPASLPGGRVPFGTMPLGRLLPEVQALARGSRCLTR